MTHLPRDDNRYPIPALRLVQNGAHEIAAVTQEARRNAVAFGADTRIVMVVAEQPVYAQSGDAAVSADATAHYLPAGVPLFLSLGEYDRHSHLAVRAVSSAGLVHVSELE